MLSVMTGEQGSRGSWRGVTSHGGNFLPVCEPGYTLLLSSSAEPATRRGDSLPRRWMLKVHAPYRSGKDGGQLVALGFEVAPFTPAPYQRPSLERPYEI